MKKALVKFTECIKQSAERYKHSIEFKFAFTKTQNAALRKPFVLNYIGEGIRLICVHPRFNLKFNSFHKTSNCSSMS